MSDKLQDLHGVVVGFGSIGNRHATNLVASGLNNLTIVRRRESNSHFDPPETATVVHSLEDAIERAPDFAIICTPSSQHVLETTRLIENGIPCLVEKPLHGDLGPSVDALLQLAHSTAAGKHSAMAYCMRYHTAYRDACVFVNNGRLGTPLYAKAWFEGYLPDWHPWEDYRASYAARIDQAGGVLRTLDHEIDYLNWVLGKATESIGMTANRNGIGIEADEIAHLTSLHESGATSQITLSFCRKPASRGFELVGTNGVLSYDLASDHLTHSSPNDPPTIVCRGDGTDIPEMYRRLLKDFVEQLHANERSPSLAPLSAGVDSLHVISQITSLQQK